MKIAAFLMALTIGVPLGALFVRMSHRWARVIFFFMVLVPAHSFNIKFMAIDTYRGDARGFEVDLANLLALTLIVGMALGRRRYGRLVWVPKAARPFWLFILIAVISIIQSEIPLYGVFTLYQILLGYLAFVAAYNFLRYRPEEIRLAVTALAVAVVVQALEVFYAKYLGGIYRAVGTFYHPNTLSLYLELLVPILLAMILHRKTKLNGLYWLAVVGGLFAVISTFSRGGLAVLGGALGLVLMLSLYQRASGRKAALLVVLTLVGLLGMIKASDTIIQRFELAPESSGEARSYFNAAAQAIANSHPVGCGLNHYSHTIGKPEYQPYFERGADRSGVCHHIYWLTAAETGYVGLAAFLLFLASFYRVAWRLTRARPPSDFNALGMGILAGLTALHLHGFLEWILRQGPIWLIFFTISGLLLAAEEHEKKRKQALR